MTFPHCGAAWTDTRLRDVRWGGGHGLPRTPTQPGSQPAVAVGIYYSARARGGEMYENKEGKAHRDKMVGFRVVGLFVSEGEDTLCLQGEVQHALIVTDADCCSETWFADITGVENLIGHTIQSFEWVDMPESYNVDDGRGRQETDEAYGIKITTEAGYCDIVYRNSSNGYYGGSASIAWRDGTATDGMKPITEDWFA